MQIAIMQPYFLPYIGYFQLMNLVDRFVIYDNIEYTKNGWINRNRLLRNGEPVIFTLPIQKDSDFLDIRDRRVAENFDPKKLENQISGAYAKAPEFHATMPVVRDILNHRSSSLFDFLRHALERTCAHIGITTPLIVSSEIEGNTSLRKQERVLDICARMEASRYVNPIGGVDLYNPNAFSERGIELKFLRTASVSYAQFSEPFQANLSILDVMMFNDRGRIRHLIENGFEIVDPKADPNVRMA
jgi:hypothetical protein